MSFATQALLLHGARVIASAALLGATIAHDLAALSVPAAVALFLAAFAANHDALHGALRLPLWVREATLLVLGGLMLLSGHAVRVMHLRHHARPLAAGDLEGAAATVGLWKAVALSPWLALRYRAQAVRRSRPRDRTFVLGETLLNVATVTVLIASGIPTLHATLVTLVLLQITMPLWAGRIPHRAPPWLLSAARAFAWTGSATVLSLAFHEEHHRAPRVPCHRLATLTGSQ